MLYTSNTGRVVTGKYGLITSLLNMLIHLKLNNFLLNLVAVQ